MWLKNDRWRNILLESNELPPSRTNVYPVRILKDNLTLDAARRLAHRAEDTSDLSFSESTELGRTEFVRRLTSYTEDDDENTVDRQPERRLARLAGARTHTSSPRVTRVRPEVNAADLPGSCGPGYTYVFDHLAVRRILEDTAAQISAVPPTPADLCCPDPGLHP
nr:unnamed protein product [Spirometra erinaceieuropaei]